MDSDLGLADTEVYIFVLLPSKTYVYTLIIYIFSQFLNHDKERPWC